MSVTDAAIAADHGRCHADMGHARAVQCLMAEIADDSVSTVLEDRRRGAEGGGPSTDRGNRGRDLRHSAAGARSQLPHGLRLGFEIAPVHLELARFVPGEAENGLLEVAR
jgi:hypothetical protein